MTHANPLRLDILPPPQQKLWEELAGVPTHFVLYGGTAIALQLGHRQSIDFDFFSNRPLDSDNLDLALPFLDGAVVTQREPNTLSVIVDRDGPVKLSFFGVPKLPRLLPPIVATSNQLHIASLLDLAGTKVSVIQMRAEAKDYVDIDALLASGITLETALASARMLYGANFNPQSALKALTFFEDDSLQDLPDELKRRLVKAIKEVDLDHDPEMPDPIYQP